MITKSFPETQLVKVKRSTNNEISIVFGLAIAVFAIFYNFKGSILSDYFPHLLDRSGRHHDNVFLFLFLPLGCIVGLLWGIWALLKSHLIRNTQRSSINTITGGFVEIGGRAKSNLLYKSPITNTDCVWYRLVFETYYKGWNEYAVYEPDNASFWIDDGTGKVTIKSSVLGAIDKDTVNKNYSEDISGLTQKNPILKVKPWFKSRWRVYECLIQPNEEVFALGYVGRSAFSPDKPEQFDANLTLQKKFPYLCLLSGEDETTVTNRDRNNAWIVILICGIILSLVGFGIYSLKSSPADITYKGFKNSGKDIPHFDPNLTFYEGVTVEENENFKFLQGIATKLNIPYSSPIELDGATKAHVLELRKKAVKSSFPNFDYQPYGPIFNEIQDGKPWWGWYGILFFGSGPNGASGPSFRSNDILNPFALIGVNFWEQNLTHNHMWNKNVVPHDEQSAQDFLLQPTVNGISIEPQGKSIEAHYNVSVFNQSLAKYLKMKISNGTMMNFSGINARDLGYPFILFDSKSSSNIKKLQINFPPSVKSNEFYHVGGSCGVAGGCNNLSPFQGTLTDYLIDTLPAKAVFKLWHKKPNKYGDAADITYTIYFD